MTVIAEADGFKRLVLFRASYDYRDDTNDKRGCHGLELHLGLRGPKGAISAAIGTGWVSRPVCEPAWSIFSGRPPRRSEGPGVDVGATAFTPTGQYLGVHVVDPEGTNECEWLDGLPCSQPQGSYLDSDRILESLVATGEGVWGELIAVYEEWVEVAS